MLAAILKPRVAALIGSLNPNIIQKPNNYGAAHVRVRFPALISCGARKHCRRETFVLQLAQ
jgi:hypothetical protein